MKPLDLSALALALALAACAPGTTPAEWPDGRGTDRPGITVTPGPDGVTVTPGPDGVTVTPGPDGVTVTYPDGSTEFIGMPEPNPPAEDRPAP